MKEIAKTLKGFGPKYILEWRMEYFQITPSLIMTLIYVDKKINLKITDQQQVPFDQIEHMDQHAPQLLYDMYRRVNEKITEAWKNFKL